MTEIAFYVMFATIKVLDQTAKTCTREVWFLGVIFSKVILWYFLMTLRYKRYVLHQKKVFSSAFFLPPSFSSREWLMCLYRRSVHTMWCDTTKTKKGILPSPHHMISGFPLISFGYDFSVYVWSTTGPICVWGLYHVSLVSAGAICIWICNRGSWREAVLMDASKEG